ncbi:MAG: metallophosphoesterase [Acutalibacteraceae bacterium]
MKKKSIIISAAAVLALAASAVFLYSQNNLIEQTRFEYRSEKIPESFNGFKIVHISDLHNKDFGNENAHLTDKIEKESPDVIFITGDIIDSRHTDFDIALSFAEKCVKIAPTYYVSGNHEHRFENIDEFFLQLESKGVNVLENGKTQIEKNGESIFLYGLSAKKEDGFSDDYSSQIQPLSEKKSKDEFSVLLAHYPQYLSDYAQAGFDVVFSGHAHGGQIRIPFTNIGIFAPDQGFFPEFVGGEYMQDNTVMYLSRGLGSSIFPLRLFDRPQVISVTLRK